MDGSPSRGETIPIRLFLGGFDLTPTFREVNKKYSTRYYLSLVLIDEGKLSPRISPWPDPASVGSVFDLSWRDPHVKASEETLLGALFPPHPMRIPPQTYLITHAMLILGMFR